MPKRKARYSAGELRIRASKQDHDRIDWLLDNHGDQATNVSELVRLLILREYERLQPKRIVN